MIRLESFLSYNNFFVFLCLLFLMKITVLCISDNDKHFRIPIEEYSKRLGNDVKIIDLSPIKWDNPSLIIKKETQRLISLLQQKYSKTYRILLSIHGEQLSTFDILKTIDACQQDIVFCIGWPYGLDEAILLPFIHKKISFGTITMPHGLVKLVLLEQIYRISMITKGKKYHY